MSFSLFTRPALALVVAASLSAPSAADDPPSSPEIASALQPFVDRGALAGAVTLVADGDKVLSVDCVGFSDVASRTPMRPDALFWIASQTKPITVAALMVLVDENKVALDDPIAKYLPEFHDLRVVAEKNDDHVLLKTPKRPVTVRDILSHTSGMPFASAVEQPTLDALPLRTAARSYAVTPLQTEPGTKYAYSNAGINTAGRIIEVVSGKPYEVFLQERILDPLGMTDTTFRPGREQIARLAKSYKPNSEKTLLEETTVDQLTYPLDDPHRQPMPAGGLFSTANDVARFCQMILNGGTFRGKRILSESSVRLMTTKQTPEPLRDGYGLGWSTDGRTFGHGGAFATNMTIDPTKRLITSTLR